MSEQFNVSQAWENHLRQSSRRTISYTCPFCADRPVSPTERILRKHLSDFHPSEAPVEGEPIQQFLQRHQVQAKSSMRDGNERKGMPITAGDKSHQSKRPLSTPTLTAGGELSNLQSLSLEPSTGDIQQGQPLVGQYIPSVDGPRKRAAIGDGGSPSSSMKAGGSEASSPRRSRARPISAQSRQASTQQSLGRSQLDTARPPATNKRLWDPESDAPLRANIETSQPFSRSRPSIVGRRDGRLQHDPNFSQMNRPQSAQLAGTFPASILSSNTFSAVDPHANEFTIELQPQTIPISQNQLVAEVKGIYAGLVMIEAKCIEVNTKQAAVSQDASATSQPQLNNEQWQALIALHRTLLHEHHDFFLASQHPSASPALRRLATRYAMPARMWRHGIHSFLELLRHRLPASLDHMVAFLYLAYSIMALLYETVPAFEDTWIECLGDLGRYRMAIEDDDFRAREVWTGVARQWYSKASDKSPTIGRLHHHLAILARPNLLQQIFHYSKSLSVVQPFESTKESILTIYEPALKVKRAQNQAPIESAFLRAHAMLFTNTDMSNFSMAVEGFTGLLDSHISRVTRNFMEQAFQIAVTNIAAVLGFGDPKSHVLKMLAESDTTIISSKSIKPENTSSAQSIDSFKAASFINNETTKVILKRLGDPNVLPYIHVILIFLDHISRFPALMEIVGMSFPRESLCTFLNTLMSTHGGQRMEMDGFQVPEKEHKRPFPEEFAVRGLLWTEFYFPHDWFFDLKIEDDERYTEVPSMTDKRKLRVLWASCQISKRGNWILFDKEHGRFYTHPMETEQEATSKTTPSYDIVQDERESSVGSSTAIVPKSETEDVSQTSRSSTWTSHTVTSLDSPEVNTPVDLSSDTIEAKDLMMFDDNLTAPANIE